MLKKLLLISLTTLLVSGCSSYYVVTSDYIKSDMPEAEPEVVETKAYKAEIGRISTLAVKAPDRCIDETAAQASGQAEAAGTILKTACGVEMALLERELARAGFKVISWKVLNNRIQSQKMTPINAATTLEAEALLQINSLEKTSVLAGQNARWDRSYFSSDSRGTPKKSVSLADQTADNLDAQAMRKEEKLTKPERLSATIDASATLVSTGQAIWFYEWTHAESEQDELETITHVSCKDNRCLEVGKNNQNLDEARSGSSEAVSMARQTKEERKSRHSALTKDVVKDLVAQFSSGKFKYH